MADAETNGKETCDGMGDHESSFGVASAEGREAPAVAGDPVPGAGAALSVTRLAPFTKQVEWKPLACGVDSLDVGFEVQWDGTWPERVLWLDAAKERAAGSEGVPSDDGRFLILPSGKAPTYRWHLQWPGFHLFIAKGRSPQNETPNVLASVNSKAIWTSSVPSVVSSIVQEIHSLGGSLGRLKLSRCDLAADFLIPGGILLQVLLDCRVPRQVKHSHNMTGDRLETFYQGAKKSPIQLRIYDKSLEVAQGGTKDWFYEIWKVEPGADVWRVEFQLRRPYLKQSGVNTVPGLISSAGGMWQYLTRDWFSLRLGDDINVSRRTIHPGWAAVQACAERFGPEVEVRRRLSAHSANADWYVNYCAGCLVSFAARLRLSDFEQAAEALVQGMRLRFRKNEYEQLYAVKSIQLGNSVGPDDTADFGLFDEMEFDE